MPCLHEANKIAFKSFHREKEKRIGNSDQKPFNFWRDKWITTIKFTSNFDQKNEKIWIYKMHSIVCERIFQRFNSSEKWNEKSNNHKVKSFD